MKNHIELIVDSIVNSTSLTKEQILCAMPDGTGYINIYVIKNNRWQSISQLCFDRFIRCQDINRDLAKLLLLKLLDYAIAFYKGETNIYPAVLYGNLSFLDDSGYKNIIDKFYENRE
jgi:hypothetical protein